MQYSDNNGVLNSNKEFVMAENMTLKQQYTEKV